jgi:hypothetical protein
MAELTLTPAQFREELKAIFLADLAVLQLAALEAAQRAEARAVALTDEKNAVVDGHFKNSWKSAPLPNGAELRNDCPYAGIIEHGRRPGRPGPPLEPIREWVHKKLVMTGEIPAKEEESAAFAIRESIHRKGTRPRLILATVWKEVEKDFMRAALQRLRRRHGR